MAKKPTIISIHSEKFKSYFDGCEKIFLDYMKRDFPTLAPDEMSFKQGSRYIKIIRGGSVHCFVDRTNGDVLKSASWKAPAKHARGNIFNIDNGLDCMGPYGAAYLKR